METVTTEKKFIEKEEKEKLIEIQNQTQSLIFELGEIEMLRISLNNRRKKAESFLETLSSDEEQFTNSLSEKYGNDVGTTIISSSLMLEMGGLMLVIGTFLLGISLIILQKYKRIIGALFIIAPVCAFLDMVIDIQALAILGWMGMFLTTLIVGILTTLQKDNQPES